MGVIGNYVTNSSRLLTHSWYLLLAFAFIFLIACIAVAAQRNIRPEANRSASFAAIYSMGVIAATSIYGQMTLTRWRSSFHVGVLLGLCTMLSQFSLTLFALFTSFSKRSGLDGDGLVASFSFFLFLLYGGFTVVLMKNRGLISEDSAALPPTPQQETFGSQTTNPNDINVAV